MPKSRRGRPSGAAKAAENASPIPPPGNRRASRSQTRRGDALCELPPVQAKPKKEPKSAKAKAETVKVAESMPNNVESKPNNVESKPNNVESKPNNVDSKPNNIEAKPNNVEAKPNNVEAKPNNVDSKPNDVEAESNNADGEGGDQAKEDGDAEEGDDDDDDNKKEQTTKVNGNHPGEDVEEMDTNDKEELVITSEKLKSTEESSTKDNEIEIVEDDEKEEDDKDIEVIKDDSSKMEVDKVTEAPKEAESEGKSTKGLAIVTGVSAGVGASICRSLVDAGMAVAALTKSSDEVKGLVAELSKSPGSLHAFECDLSKEEQVSEAFTKATAQFGPVHICVNNGGSSSTNALLEGSVEEWRSVLDVNVIALCLLTKLCVKNMTENDVAGHVIHVGSMSGGHRTNFYAATKFAVRALTDGLRNELRAQDSKIRISSVSPGDGEATEGLKAEDIAETVMHLVNAPAHIEMSDVVTHPKA